MGKILIFIAIMCLFILFQSEYLFYLKKSPDTKHVLDCRNLFITALSSNSDWNGEVESCAKTTKTNFS